MPGLLERTIQSRGGYQAGNPNDERYWNGNSGQSGIVVTADSALSYDAFYACVANIAEDVALLPFDVLKKRRLRGRDELPDHPVAHIFNVQANDQQLGYEWREWMVRISILYPEAVSEILTNRGRIEQCRPLLPAWLKKQTDPAGRTQRYEVREPQKPVRYLALDEVFRLPSRLGLGIIELAKADIAAALGANRTAAALAKNGLTPRMALEHPGTLSPKAEKRLSQSVSEKVAGPENAGHIPVFEEGLKWIKIGVSPEEAQFLEGQEFSVLKMARWMRMQPHKLAYMVTATFASIEQQNIEHVIDTIRPWCTRYEKASDSQLTPMEAGVYSRHNLNALLRGDALTRAQAHEIWRRNGIINANEWREDEDLNPRPDAEGETYWNTQPGTGTSNAPGSSQSPKGQALAFAAAGRMVSKEIAAARRNAVKYADDPDGWGQWCIDWWGEHASDVARNMLISDRSAAMYCEAKADELATEGLAVLDRYEGRDIPLLAGISLEDEPAVALATLAPPVAVVDNRPLVRRVERDEAGRIISVTEERK